MVYFLQSKLMGTCCRLIFWHSVTKHFHKDFHSLNIQLPESYLADCWFVNQKFNQADDEHLHRESEQVHCLDECQLSTVSPPVTGDEPRFRVHHGHRYTVYQ